MPFKLSPSSLNLFRECSRCFWLDKHGVWKRPSGIFPSLPSGMDKVLKEHFDRFRDKGELPPEICDNDHCGNMRLFGENGQEKDLLAVWRSNFKGIRWSDSDGNVLSGAVDNLLKHGEKLVVLDYKTRGFPLKEDTHEHYQLQLDSYNFLLQKNGYKTEDYAFLLFYFPDKVLESGEVVFNTEFKKMKTSPENAEKTYNKAIECLKGEKPEKRCEWCGKV